jgi:phosphonate transport system substrate-binding protein
MKLKKLFSGLTAGVAMTAVLAAPQISQAEEMKTLNFGILSSESSQNLRTRWEPFLADMSEDLGMEVKPFFASDYAGIIQAMRFDKVDVAWHGNKSAMEAVDRAGGEIFAQTVDASGNPGYWSLLIAHKDNDAINSVDDVLKKAGELSFGNGDPNSTSGFLVPNYYVFAKNGVEPKKIFKRMTNAGHEANFLAVANGQVDVATNNNQDLARIQVTHPDKYDQVKVVWKSPLIPSDPIVWRKNLPENVKSKIHEFFMSYGTTGDEQELAVLKALQWAPFKASTDDQLLPIRQLELFKQRAQVASDDKLSSDAKAAKLDEIDAQLSALNSRMDALESASAN